MAKKSEIIVRDVTIKTMNINDNYGYFKPFEFEGVGRGVGLFINVPKGHQALSPRQHLGYEGNASRALKGQKLVPCALILMPLQGEDTLPAHNIYPGRCPGLIAYSPFRAKRGRIRPLKTLTKLPSSRCKFSKPAAAGTC